MTRREQTSGRDGGFTGGVETLARSLGWLSIGLGLAELAAPRTVARLIGAPHAPLAILRAFGAREVASGIGILSQSRPVESVWSRVAGDALDLACLGAAFTSTGADRRKLTAATAAVLGITALDLLCAQQAGGRGWLIPGGEIRTRHSVTINASTEELYRFWRDFENLPAFMEGLWTVETTGDGRSRWAAKGPGGTTIQWEAVIAEDVANELIAWRTVEGSDVDHAGTVRFKPAPAGRGSVVTVEMRYRIPGGAAGKALAALFGEEPGQRIQEDLRRFKQVMETGEITRSDATLDGTGLSQQRPAQPAPEALSMHDGGPTQ